MSFTKPGRPANGSCVCAMNCEYAFVMLGWLPAQPNAERSRRLLSAPALLSTMTYDAESLGNVCQRSDGAKGEYASSRTPHVKKGLIRAVHSWWPSMPMMRM